MIFVHRLRNNLYVVLLFLLLFMTTSGTLSKQASAVGESCDIPQNSILGIPTWYKYLDGAIDERGECSIKVPGEENSKRSVKVVLPIGLAVLEILLSLGGLVAVGMVFWGAFKYVLTQGEPDKAAGARKTVINAMIGLVIIIISTRLVSFIAGTLG